MRAVLALVLSSGVLFAADKPAAPLEGEAKAADILKTGLASGNPETRIQAVVALGLVGVREPYTTWAEGMMKDKDVKVRVSTITTLVDLRDTHTVSLLQEALHDRTPEVSFAAAKALWTLDEPDGRTALIAVLDKESKTSSNFFTAQMRDTLRLFHTPMGIFLVAIKGGAAFAPVPGAGAGVASLQNMLSNRISGRAAAALLMANDQTPEVLTALKDALMDKDATVRAAAAHAIAMRGDTSLIDAIAPLMDDKKSSVRFRAAAAFLRLTSIRQGGK